MRIDHLALPFVVDRRGQARTVDQDSETEILQSVRALVGTTPGERLVVPAYGVDDLTFVGPDDINEEWLADAVEQWEPRATVEVTRAAINQTGRTQVTVEVDN